MRLFLMRGFVLTLILVGDEQPGVLRCHCDWTGVAARLDKPVHPALEAQAVDDHEVGAGYGGGVARAWFEDMCITIRADQSLDGDMLAADIVRRGRRGSRNSSPRRACPRQKPKRLILRGTRTARSARLSARMAVISLRRCGDDRSAGLPGRRDAPRRAIRGRRRRRSGRSTGRTPCPDDMKAAALPRPRRSPIATAARHMVSSRRAQNRAAAAGRIISPTESSVPSVWNPPTRFRTTSSRNIWWT